MPNVQPLNYVEYDDPSDGFIYIPDLDRKIYTPEEYAQFRKEQNAKNEAIQRQRALEWETAPASHGQIIEITYFFGKWWWKFWSVLFLNLILSTL